MQDKVQIYRSITPGAAPTALLYGELAINIPDNRFWVGDEAGLPVEISLGGESPTVSLKTASFLVDAADGMDHHYRVISRGMTVFIPDTLPVGHRFQIDCKDDTLIVDGNVVIPPDTPLFTGILTTISDFLGIPITPESVGFNFRTGGPVTTYSFTSDANGLVIDSISGEITGEILTESTVSTSVQAVNESGIATSNNFDIIGLPTFPYDGTLLVGNTTSGNTRYGFNLSAGYGLMTPPTLAGRTITSFNANDLNAVSFELLDPPLPINIASITITLSDPIALDSAVINLPESSGRYTAIDAVFSAYLFSKDAVTLDVNIIETI